MTDSMVENDLKPFRVDLSEASLARPAEAPTVSVLIKAFNHAPYVRQIIESVLAQSFQDFEIVVTDDGSADETLEILRSFPDPRIRLEALGRNQGISAAMNATITRARGRYLAILNSDDWALPGRLERQVSFLDAHPGISLVFGLPQAVDEAGEPTVPFNDFELPLAFPDFSRRSWLRHFFFHGNCLCAPTAMIRREAYVAVGAYDPRLTNLQDLDMWVRMLIAGRNIHVLPERLTAFRIRDNNANMSAPRPDAILRHRFETTKILARFAGLDAETFEDMFGAEAPGTVQTPVGLRLAELACRNPNIEYQNFALTLFHETARETEDFHRLRVLAGTLDAFGAKVIEMRDRQIAEAASNLADSRANIVFLRERVDSLERSVQAFEHSTSWRLTWPMRVLWRRLSPLLRQGCRRLPRPR
jgi:glycosyltransferase involved in cell wall biosynthesis